MAGEFRLGDALLRDKLITKDQLTAALEWQRCQVKHVPLGQILVRQKVVTQRQLNAALGATETRPQLGELLIRIGSVTRSQLDHALHQQKKDRSRLGQTLLKLGYVTDEAMRQALSVQLEIPYVDLEQMEIDRDLGRVINRNYARRHSVVPVARIGDTLTVCMDDPTDRKVVDELARSTGLALTVITSSHEAIKRAFKRLYEEPQPAPVEGDTELIELVADDGPRSRMSDEFRQTKTADSVVRRLLATAIERRCSDIHVETLANRLQVRFRIDGVLEHLDVQELVDACNDSPREIVSRFKILAKLDISERRRPQDGSFRVKVDRGGERRDIDLRLSVVPSHFGEGIVVRVLDRQNVPTSIDSLDFPPAMTDALRQLLARPNGIFLVTGPTGSGKSTTLYASLSTLYRPGIRILTAEDPVEYIYEQFSQSEVNQAIGNTFASYLRAFLRHDPEVIMVGEIRDNETAEMAFRAAQTGHLLLSTLHTNSAIGAVPRLLDLDVDPNTLASSIVGVIGQRLLRKVCDGCRVERVPSADLLEAFFGGMVPDGLKLYAGEGCQACNFTGYRGRCTIVELWVPSEHDILLINQNVPFEQIRASAANSTFTMADTAWERLASGRTNLEELVRVMPYLAVTDFRERYGRSLAAA